MKIAAVVLFIAMYALMIILPEKRRPWIACGVALIFLILGILPWGDLASVIDWNILLMIFGTVVIVDYFIQSKMPNLLADRLLDLAPNVMWVTILMSLFAGIVSAFIDNVATVYMIAPVGLAICKKLKISPVPMIISIAVSSNLQGAATLVGDTTSIMLAGAAHMDFNDFFWFQGRPGVFFAVEVGALLTIPIMLFLFRKEKKPVSADEYTKVTDYIPTIAMVGHIVCLIGASFFKNKPEITNGMICLIWGIGCIIAELVKTGDKDTMIMNLKNVDYQTIFLLAGLFAVIGGITNMGIIDDISKFIIRAGGNNYFLLYTIVVWGSVLISAFIDNIPYVATMLPVIGAVAGSLGVEPYLLYYGLLIGATLGGNITPIGASANIAGTGLLRREGYEVSFGQFMRIGLPFTLAAVTGGYISLWLFWR
ncbi:MAG: SLC13 family permease [Lachnospiraceae bacterium]|nr:SLC13 family permease [Lachnospiraceae bacterium]